ncbi:MAG: polysaccharide deacetylase family protein [Pseudomonadota bacterium]
MMGRIALIGSTALILLMVGCGHGQQALLPLGEQLQPEALFRLPTDERVIYLTIDDGPSASTGTILDLLARYEATATMFVHTDHIAGHEEMIARAVAEGHSFANHLPEDRSAKEFPPELFAAEFNESHCALEAITGTRPFYFRPPLGAYRTERMGPALQALDYAAPGGRSYILTSFLPWDAGGMTETRSQTFNRLAAGFYGRQLGGSAFPGSIVIFHDGPRAIRTEHTLHSLEVFLKRATARGFAIKGLPTPSVAAFAPCQETPESQLASSQPDG